MSRSWSHASGAAREDCGRPVQSRRPGFARRGRAVSAQSVRRSRDHQPPRLRTLPSGAVDRRHGARRSRGRSTPISAGVRRSFRKPSNRRARWKRRCSARGHQAKCVIAMRYWHPLTAEAVAAVKAFSPDHIVLLPLYPQYSTTTTGSSLAEWRKLAARALDRAAPRSLLLSLRGRLRCGAVRLARERVQDGETRPRLSRAVLGAWPAQAHHRTRRSLSMAGGAHRAGRPRTLAGRDPRSHDLLPEPGRAAGMDRSRDRHRDPPRRRASGKALIVVPVAFVSEHSETLVELDIEYGKLARNSGVPDYIRVPAVRSHPDVHRRSCPPGRRRAELAATGQLRARRICPAGRTCGYERTSPHA